MKGNNMNDKIATAKTFVKKHKTAIACATGVVIGTAATYVTLTNGRMLLQLDDDAAESVGTGGAARFNTNRGRIYVALETYLPEE